MKHPNLVKWEKRLRSVFDKVDDYLEDKYGNEYPLHPNRAKRGKTSSKEMDGLFNIGAAFSAGFGSKYGRGYVIDVDISTLSNIPEEIREKIENDAIDMVRKEIAAEFKERKVEVVKDGNVFKIYGDLSLGKTFGK